MNILMEAFNSGFTPVFEAKNIMSLEKFVSTHKVDKNLKPAREKQIGMLKAVTEVEPGDQFREYLLSYGALSYKFIEFLGISGSEPDAVPKLAKDTIILRKYGKNVPTNMIPIYKIHDEGLYAMVDESDNVYEVDVYHYFKGMNTPKNTKMKFEEYIVTKFMEADSN